MILFYLSVADSLCELDSISECDFSLFDVDSLSESDCSLFDVDCELCM